MRTMRRSDADWTRQNAVLSHLASSLQVDTKQPLDRPFDHFMWNRDQATMIQGRQEN